MAKSSQMKVAQLVSAYEHRLDQDRRELLASGDAGNEGADPSKFAVVRFIAHRIAGSARVFGCEELADPARNVERLVDEGAASDVIVGAVNELTRRIDETLASGLPEPDWMK
ncbi:Hpt domain-containing protein [Roseibium sp. Sym1]|uniref:Hpt domain-containing protein n=1 Tax=Roseibium sp. Sym1 TaxID=3016006 RepID=UPI0022B4BB61|nr:Hpt domain-containing protein [Roseibium sp. Sym1]